MSEQYHEEDHTNMAQETKNETNLQKRSIKNLKIRDDSFYEFLELNNLQEIKSTCLNSTAVSQDFILPLF